MNTNLVIKSACAVLAVAVLAGCATDGAMQQKVMSAKPVAATADEARFGTLAPRQMAAGQCAMFLWVRNAERKLVFYGSAAGEARAVLDGREVGMTRTAIDGHEAFGQYEDQTYIYEGQRIQVRVDFERRAGMDRGVVVPQGTLRLQQADGWETVLPVGGLVACEG
jgi:hypothetical protein